MSEDAYSIAVRLAKALQGDLEERINQALVGLGDPYLVRARLSACRIKNHASLGRKAKERAWTLEQAITKVSDFIGFRIVCNNLQDVERTAQLIQENLERAGFRVRRRDYIRSPLNTGYRAIHLLFKVNVTIASETLTLGSEIQIRTLLQDTWGHLSHADIYKEQVSESLLGQTKRLADTLARADRIAEQIRRRVVRPAAGKMPTAGAPLTRSSVAFIYHRAFNEYPPEYVAESTLREFGATPIRADGLDQILQDKNLIECLESNYGRHTRWAPGPEQVFRWAVHAAINGQTSALSLAAHEGRRDWADVDKQYKSELSSAIPKGMDELRNWLHDAEDDGDPSWDVVQWAEYFDVATRCEMCGSTLVDVDTLARKLVRHFGLEGQQSKLAYERILSILIGSGVEDADGGALCGHCHYVMNKDD